MRNKVSNGFTPYLDVVHIKIVLVQTGDEEVVGDVVQVTTELQPGTGGRDMIGCALALNLDQDLGTVDILAIPGLEGLEELEAVGGGVDVDGFGAAVGWWVGVVVLAFEPALIIQLLEQLP